MASDIFAKIGDIKGESLDDKHKDEVEVLSWSWGVSQSGSMAHGGGGGEGKASFNDFNFTHHIDKASPVPLLAGEVMLHPRVSRSLSRSSAFCCVAAVSPRSHGGPW